MKLLRLPAFLLLLASLVVPASAAYEGWMTDLAAARAKAAAENKRLVVEFTGSTWCPPCKALHAEVLTSPEFAAWSRDKVLVMLDFPRASERSPEKVAANPELAKLMQLKEEFAVTGFPTLFVLDPAGRPLGKQLGYIRGQGPVEYLKKLGVD